MLLGVRNFKNIVVLNNFARLTRRVRVHMLIFLIEHFTRHCTLYQYSFMISLCAESDTVLFLRNSSQADPWTM